MVLDVSSPPGVLFPENQVLHPTLHPTLSSWALIHAPLWKHYVPLRNWNRIRGVKSLVARRRIWIEIEVKQIRGQTNTRRRGFTQWKAQGYAFTQWRLQVLCQVCSALPLMFLWKETATLSSRSVSQTCLLINITKCFILPFYCTEIRVSRSNQDSYGCLLLWTVARLLA